MLPCLARQWDWHWHCVVAVVIVVVSYLDAAFRGIGPPAVTHPRLWPGSPSASPASSFSLPLSLIHRDCCAPFQLLIISSGTQCLLQLPERVLTHSQLRLAW